MSCEKQLSPTEQKAGKELADKYWNTPGSFLIPIEL